VFDFVFRTSGTELFEVEGVGAGAGGFVVVGTCVVAALVEAVIVCACGRVLTELSEVVATGRDSTMCGEEIKKKEALSGCESGLISKE